MHVTGLFIYPVKSCRGISLSESSLDALGLLGDRRFLVVDDQGNFLTQRTHVGLVSVATALDATHLTLTHPQLPPLKIPVVTPVDQPSPPVMSVTLWRTTGLIAEDCGAAASAWFSDVLKQSTRLVRIGPAFQRPVGDLGDFTAFADGYPLLAISDASLANLYDRLVGAGEEPVPMDRFRPNVVIAGSDAFAEDNWPRVRIGEAVFRTAGLCARCIVTTTDQLTGQRHGAEPLRALARYRRDPATPTNLNFGQNLINETKSARLRIGDPVTPLD
jgi:uncharacterized protein YcbX